MKRILSLCALIALAVNFIFAQQATVKDEQPDEIKRLNEFSRRLSYAPQDSVLKRLEKMRALAIEFPAAKPLEHGMLLDIMSQETVNLGNYRDALVFADFKGKTYADNPADADLLKDYRAVPAVEAVAEAAADRQIVIINEAHHVPQHRVITIELLKALKKQGYKYFAAETLFETDPDLNKRGYPLTSSGAYLEEPIYGDVIRTALKLGYKVIAYDLNGTGPDARERGAATNLKNRIFDRDPQAKVLIHVGYGHNAEIARPNGNKMLAGYLKEFTGIDPVTIDQTAMTEHSAPEYEFSLYRAVTARYKPVQPIVFRNSKGEFWTLKDYGRDITVFSPRSVYINNRPTWLGLNGERRQYLLAKDICAAQAHCLVRARLADESAEAVPLDRIEAKTNQVNALMLPKGNFVVESEDAQGGKLKTFSLKR
jgi:hypothetical protein